MENLFGQEYKDGFVVNTEKPKFIALSTNMKLGTNIDKAQYDYENQVNKLFNINSNLGTSSYLPKTSYMKVKEANNLLNVKEPKIKHQEHEEYDELRRINLQIQDRLNERALNQIDTAFAPQGLTNNQVIALSSTKPKLQKEIEAVEEYARTHSLTADQTKKLREELIKRNYDEWIENINQVNQQQTGAPKINPINKRVQPTEAGATETKESETNDETTATGILNTLLGYLSGNNGNQQTPTAEPTPTAQQTPTPKTSATKVRQRTKGANPLIVRRTPKPNTDTTPTTQPAEPNTGAGVSPIRQPKVDEGDQPITNPVKPRKKDTQQVLDDKEQYPEDYIDNKPIVNLTLNPTEDDYSKMVKEYFENYFIQEFIGQTMIKKDVANKFLSYFQPYDEQGLETLRGMFFGSKVKKTQYLIRFFTAINTIFTARDITNQVFFQIKDGANFTFPKSQIQQDKFINVFGLFVSKCKNLLLQNMDVLYMDMNEKTDNLVFRTQEDLNKFRKDVKAGVITGKNIFDFTRIGTAPDVMANVSEYENLLDKFFDDLKDERKWNESKKLREKKISEKKNVGNTYSDKVKEKHEKLIEQLKIDENTIKDLGTKLGMNSNADIRNIKEAVELNLKKRPLSVSNGGYAGGAAAGEDEIQIDQ